MNHDEKERSTQPTFAEPLHTVGEYLHVPTHAMRLALAWWVGAELVRRHPQKLRLIESFPHQYGPALTLWELQKTGPGVPRLLMTLGKVMHITPLDADWNAGRFNWLDVLLADNRREYVVVQLERMLGLVSPAHTPATTRASIGPRVLAAFLSRGALGSDRWAVGGGTFDDDDDSGVAEELFRAMPAVAKDVVTHAPTEHPLGMAESRYWFVGRIKKEKAVMPPLVAVDMFNGRAWTGAEHFDLLRLYRGGGGSIDRVVNVVFPPAA